MIRRNPNEDLKAVSMTTPTETPRVSDCCNAPFSCKDNMKYNGSELRCVGTYYVCSKCQKICDATETPVEKLISHPEMVSVLVKPGSTILKELTPLDCHLWHMASCIPGEAGEIFDAVKKLVIYRKELDRVNLIEELGDIEFYLEGLRQALDISREETLEANITKLGKRYMDFKYSNEQAQARKDKVE